MQHLPRASELNVLVTISWGASVEKPRRTRVTIVDIARELDLSVASVSYALNGKAGVSEATRERVQETAHRLGWSASPAAKALQSQRSNMIGMVMRREFPEQPMLGDFMVRFIDGLNEPLTDRPESLLWRTVRSAEAELGIYRTWAAQNRVDAVVLFNILADVDPRIALLSELGLPTVVVGDLRGRGGPPSVWTDDEEAMRITIEHFVAKGHRRIARIREGGGMLHAAIRSTAFAATLAEMGLPPGVDLLVASGSGASPTELLRSLLAGPDAPTAFQYDNALQAAAAIRTVRSLGYRIPEDIAILTWDNSGVCEVTDPPVTAIDRDSYTYGRTVGEEVLALLATGVARDTRGTVSHLMERGST